MRKTLALVLSAVMVLSLALVGVSAEDLLTLTVAETPATEIKTAEEYAAMAADGNYKLAADIKIDASWGAGDDPATFTGTFDGNGHTVTISAPMFVKFCGIIKNLTINGSASKEGTANEVASYCGAIANNIPNPGEVTGVATFENITNNAYISGAYRIGGFIGQASSNNIITLTNCVNNGTVDGGNMVGGFIGYSQNNTITFTDCVNNGKVFINTEKSLAGLAGGIIGRFGGDTSYKAETAMTLTFTNCLNTGAITGTSQTGGIIGFCQNANAYLTNCTNTGAVTSSYKADGTGSSDAAGIFASSGTGKGYYSIIYIDKCVNEGKVVSKNGRAAGIASYVWCGNNNGSYIHAEITNCVNKGDVEGGSFVAQILAYSNDCLEVEAGKKQPTKIQGVGIGTLSRCADSTRDPEPNADGKNSVYYAVIGCSSSALGTNLDYDLTLIDTQRLDWVAYSEGTPANRIAISEKPDTIKLASAADCQKAIEALGTVGYVAPAAPVDPTPSTGDNAVWFAVIGAVALLGTAVVIKKVNA